MSQYLDYAGLSTVVDKIRSRVAAWIGVTASGSASKFLNEHGDFVPVQSAAPDGDAGIVYYSTIELDPPQAGQLDIRELSSPGDLTRETLLYQEL